MFNLEPQSNFSNTDKLLYDILQELIKLNNKKDNEKNELKVKNKENVSKNETEIKPKKKTNIKKETKK